mmetsp:Transcript_19676/g.24309  ORF Transcript_19676/g.24309 Transcript_19676/m.24309 type:complete len:80 (-) Transcript_19676:158-397(-)
MATRDRTGDDGTVFDFVNIPIFFSLSFLYASITRLNNVTTSLCDATHKEKKVSLEWTIFLGLPYPTAPTPRNCSTNRSC